MVRLPASACPAPHRSRDQRPAPRAGTDRFPSIRGRKRPFCAAQPQGETRKNQLQVNELDIHPKLYYFIFSLRILQEVHF